MPKTLPAEVVQDSINPYSGGAWLMLCEIAIPTQDTQYLARNTEGVTYAGQDYDAFNFEVSEQVWTSDGSIPRITIRIAQDRNRVIESIINETQGGIDGVVSVFKVGENFLDDPIPALHANYDILSSESDDEWVTFTLGIPNPLIAVIPKRIYTSKTCPFATPSLFKGPECGYSGTDTECVGSYNACYAKGNQARFGADLGLDPNGMLL